jgi:hypothetical protein
MAVEQFLGHAAAFQDQAHEGEERDGQQGGVGHDAEHPVRQGLQLVNRRSPSGCR